MEFKLKEIPFMRPDDLYVAIRGEEYPFLLESLGKKDRKARFTFLGCDPAAIIEIDQRGTEVKVLRDVGLEEERIKEENPFDALEEIFKDLTFDVKNPFGEKAFLGGLLGIFNYDAVYPVWLKKGDTDGHGTYAQFCFYDRVFIYDNREERLFLSSSETDDNRIIGLKEMKRKGELNIIKDQNSPNAKPKDFPTQKIEKDAEREEYINMVEEAKRHVIDGDVIQVVISREERIKTDADPFDLYLKLRRLNPSPYMFFLEFNDMSTLIGASPETMSSIFRRKILINPIAGTIDRGKDEEEDKILAKELLNDEKELAEHNMLVDLARNDVRRVSKRGSVKLEGYLDVLSYSHVQHIESEVSGELRDDISAFKAVESSFPAGTLSGAPKIRAMEIIDELERSKRGAYGGGLGYFSVDGSADFAIVIRTAIVDAARKRRREVRIRAGAGIVADSIPEKEFLETEKKLRPLKSVLGVT
jgi:anthranilate synthase component 1